MNYESEFKDLVEGTVRDCANRSEERSPFRVGEINLNQNTRGKYKVKISLFIRNIYQRTYLEDICSRFD